MKLKYKTYVLIPEPRQFITGLLIGSDSIDGYRTLILFAEGSNNLK